EPRREEERVALAERYVERAGQDQHHLAAGLRPPRLDEAEMARRYLRLVGEGELAEVAGFPPVLKEGADADHAPSIAAGGSGSIPSRGSEAAQPDQAWAWNGASSGGSVMLPA